MNPEELIKPEPTPVTTYVKWIVLLFILIGLYLLLRPYFPIFAKLWDIIKLSFSLLFSKTASLEKKDPEANIGDKLVMNKEPKPAPKPDEFCYVGEWKGVRQCVQVDKSTCTSQTYSTQSHCVNPTST